MDIETYKLRACSSTNSSLDRMSKLWFEHFTSHSSLAFLSKTQNEVLGKLFVCSLV